MWLSFYKNDIVKKTAFREEVFFEDLDYVYRTIWTIGQNGKIGVIDFPFYGYRANPFSTTNKHSIKSFIDNCKANEEVINFCHSCEDMSEECKQNCYDRLRKSLINLLLVSRNYSLNNSNKALKEIDIVTLFRIIDQKANWKQRTIIFTYKIFPFLILLTIRGLVLVKRFITH